MFAISRPAVALVALIALASTRPAAAQPPASAPTIGVLATLTVKSDVARDQMIVATDDLHLHTQLVERGDGAFDFRFRWIEEQQKATKDHVPFFIATIVWLVRQCATGNAQDSKSLFTPVGETLGNGRPLRVIEC